jgi:hypothetical protein
VERVESAPMPGRQVREFPRVPLRLPGRIGPLEQTRRRRRTVPDSTESSVLSLSLLRMRSLSPTSDQRRCTSKQPDRVDPLSDVWPSWSPRESADMKYAVGGPGAEQRAALVAILGGRMSSGQAYTSNAKARRLLESAKLPTQLPTHERTFGT